MEINELRSKLKDRLALGLNYGIQSLEEALDKSSMLKNEMVTFRSQYNDLNRIATQGILGYEQVEMGYNKLRMGLLELIDKMEGSDLTDQQKLPKVQNKDLQHRKENFFELLNLHLRNLEAIRVQIQSGSYEKEAVEFRSGREAIAFIFSDIFKYQFKRQQQKPMLDIKAYSSLFFEKYYPSLEVYMKTLSFILHYIEEEEVEQSFFNGVVRSLLSNNEVALMVYYALSGIEPSFPALLTASEILEERHLEMLLDREHGVGLKD